MAGRATAFSPKIRAAVAQRAGSYAKQLAETTGRPLDGSLEKLASEGNFQQLRARLAETRVSLDSQVAHFKATPAIADSLRMLNNSLNDMHSSSENFWKDKSRERPIDFGVFRENIRSPGVVDQVEKRFADFQENPEPVVQQALNPESYLADLEKQLKEALVEGEQVQTEAAAQVADVEEQMKVVAVERDNLLYAVVEDELAQDPEFSAQLEKDMIENNWDPNPEQEKNSPASGASMPW